MAPGVSSTIGSPHPGQCHSALLAQLFDLFFEFGEEVEGVDGFELIEVGGAEFVEDGAVKRGEEEIFGFVAVVVASGAGSEGFAEFVFALFVPLEDFAGALNDRFGEASEASDLDAVAFVGASGFDAAQENNFARSFLDTDVDVFDGGEKVGELREFMIMRGEERARASVLLEMLDDGPGNGKAVKGGGAAADFVEKDEACRRGVMEDGGDFAHFDEESGAAAGEIIGSTDAGEDAVGDGQLGLARGNEGTHLSHENDKRGLAEVGRLAAHVGASDEEKLLAAWFEAEIIGDEALAFLAEKFLDDGMAAANDEEFADVIEFGADVAAVGGELCERGENVELGDGRRCAAKARGFRSDASAKVHEKLAFDFEDTLIGSEDFPFVFL